MDGGRRYGNLIAKECLTARTAMEDGARGTQRQCRVDDDGRLDGNSTLMDLTATDGAMAIWQQYTD
jgi:hypothetical protein